MFMGAAGPDFGRAQKALKEYIEKHNKTLPDDEQQFLNSHDHECLKTWWEHWIDNGSVADEARSGRPNKCNTADALEAAQICKDGKLVDVKEKGRKVQHRVHFTSLAEAIRERPRLGEIMANIGLKYPEQLLHAMHLAEPSLVRRKLFFKHSFTEQELQERMDYAKWCLNKLSVEPDFLQHTIYIDESSFIVDKYTESDVWVWCDKHDLNFSDVVGRQLKKGHKFVTVKFIVAVTSHPAFADRGCVVYMEFTTGTTNIRRHINTRQDGGEVERDMEYEVSLLHQADSVVAITVSVTSAVGNQPQQQLYVGHIEVTPAHQGGSICGRQHNAAPRGCTLQGGAYAIRVAKVVRVHTHKAAPLLHCCHILHHVKPHHLPCAVVVHANPVAPAINLNKVPPLHVEEIHGPVPKRGDHLAAELRVHPPPTQQLHEAELTGWRHARVLLPPQLLTVHAEGAPQVRGVMLVATRIWGSMRGHPVSRQHSWYLPR
jgi:hypothetical protein